MNCPRPIDSYLHRVAESMRGPAKERNDIISELRSVLLDIADAHRSAGMSYDDAVKAAVDEFGDSSTVAASFEPELAAKQVRRLTFALAATAVPIGLLWAHAAQASDGASHAGGFWHVIAAPPVPIALVALGLALWTALVTMAATGRLTRWFPQLPRLALLGAAAGSFGVVLADLAILVLLGGQVAGATSSLSPAPVAAAAIATTVHGVLVRRGAYQCLDFRGAFAVYR